MAAGGAGKVGYLARHPQSRTGCLPAGFWLSVQLGYGNGSGGKEFGHGVVMTGFDEKGDYRESGEEGLW